MANKRFKGCTIRYFHRGIFIYKTIGCGGKYSWYMYSKQEISDTAFATVGAAMKSIDKYRDKS